MIDNIFHSSARMPNGSIKELYEFCMNELTKEKGRSAVFSMYVYANELILRPIYNELVSKLYDVRKDEGYMDYLRKRDEIILKFADRNNDGTIVYEHENQPRITENIVEFEAAMKELNESSKDTIATHESGLQSNRALLSEIQDVKLFNIDVFSIPDDVPPRMISFLVSSDLKKLFAE